MPKYYFDLREDGQLVTDNEGQNLPDLDSAEREAAEVAGEISRNKLPKSLDRATTIEVRNEHGQHVLTAMVGLKVVRGKPASV